MSPAVHNAAFAQADMDAVYLPFKVHDPRTFLEGFETYDLRGLSVTIPHKQTMLEMMDSVDDLAARIGAVNTVRIDEAGRFGTNPDVAAAVAAVENAARRAGTYPMDRTHVLMVGAGGAARAIAHGLSPKVARLTIANRTIERAQTLAAEFNADCCSLDEMAALQPDILVNTTSVGMWPRVDQSPVPTGMLRAGMVVFDAVYNPLRTKLLQQAEATGAVTASGVEWFVNQAAAQFELWTGCAAPRDVMEQTVRERLAGS